MPISESSQIKKYITKRLLHENTKDLSFFCEQVSHDTLGSLFFLSLLYVEPLSIKEVIFITSDFHMSRVKGILIELKRLGFYKNCEFFFEACSSTYSEVKLKARINYENTSLIKIQSQLKLLKTREDFFINFITNHSCYNCSYHGRIIEEDELY